MMFKDKANRPNLQAGYERYLKRCVKTPKERVLTFSQYVQTVYSYCRMLAGRLESQGTADLPCGIGSIVAVSIRCTPTYDRTANKWRSRSRNGAYTFGFIFSPRRVKGNENLRCYGVRANAALYNRMRKKYNDGMLPFHLAAKETYV